MRVAIPDLLVRAARAAYGKDKHLIKLRCDRREAIFCEGRVVGFVTPHQDTFGWRHGPMFVLPAYRGRGLVETYYAAHPERACVAFVEHVNVASRKMHERAGFKPWRKHKLGIYMRREPLLRSDEQESQVA